MIKVKLFKSGAFLIGFEMKGHAFHADPGEDIVCAAASMLATNCIDVFTDILKKEVKYKVDDGYARLDIDSNAIDDNSQLIMKSFELGIISILRGYSESIALYYKEV